MATYIYLNYYKCGALYVGSHTWDGPEGILDPNYVGSSHFAEMVKWKPYKIRILEVVNTERRFIAEREWILRYVTWFGIYPPARKFARSDWHRQFPDGRMLNLHCNDAQQATLAAAEKVRICGLSETQLEVRRRLQPLLTEAARRPEAIDKMKRSHNYKEVSTKRMAVQLENGSYSKFQSAGWKATASKESIEKRTRSHNYEEVALKNSVSKKGISPTYYKVRATKGDDNFVGPLRAACIWAGNKNWQIKIGREFKKGVTQISHHDVLFELL